MLPAVRRTVQKLANLFQGKRMGVTINCVSYLMSSRATDHFKLLRMQTGITSKKAGGGWGSALHNFTPTNKEGYSFCCDGFYCVRPVTKRLLW